MKRIYLLGALAVITAVSCSPDTKELDVLKEPVPTVPSVNTPPVDLSTTLITFLPSERVEQIYRDPETKTISATTFTFAPQYAKRALKSGESVNVKIEVEKSGYERSLPEGSFSIDKAEINSATASDTFAVTLKPEGFKELDVKQEYVLRLKAKVVSTNPANLSVATTDFSVYRIKIKFVEDKFPQGDNFTILDEFEEENLIDSSKYDFESDYYSNHLWKLKDGSTRSNWWVDTTKPEITLVTKFSEETLVNGIIVTLEQLGERWELKTVGKMDIYASPDGIKDYLQGTYVRDKYRGKIYVKFKTPIKVKTITFKNFKKYEHKYIDLSEIEFF